MFPGITSRSFKLSFNIYIAKKKKKKKKKNDRSDSFLK